jgi:hypothetical protein
MGFVLLSVLFVFNDIMRFNNATVQARASEFDNIGGDMMRRNVIGSPMKRDRRFRSWFGTWTIVCAWGYTDEKHNNVQKGSNSID